MSEVSQSVRARRTFLGDPPEWKEGVWVHLDGGRVLGWGGGPVGARLDLPDAILTPGLVNAHTHLELSRAPLSSADDFWGFLESMKDYRPTVSPEELGVAAAEGAAECLASGTTAVMDLPTTVESARALAATPLHGVLAAEVIAFLPGHLDREILRTQEILSLRREGITGAIFLHAPYTVCPAMRQRARVFAEQEGLLLASHVLESPEEIELLTRRAGPMAAAFGRLGLLEHLARPADPLEILRDHEGMVLVHLASAGDAVSSLPAETPVVLCPRSNHTLGVGPAPADQLIAAGCILALGTDSRASAPDLDLRAEMRAATETYELAPATVLAMATWGGALVLDRPDLGRIAPQSRADLVAWSDSKAPDPATAVLEAEQILGVMVDGTWRTGELASPDLEPPPTRGC